jgi:hypothetical protein
MNRVLARDDEEFNIFQDFDRCSVIFLAAYRADVFLLCTLS